MKLTKPLKKAKFFKAPGPDNIQNEMIKFLWKNDENILYELFNNCSKNEQFPTQWKEARVQLLQSDKTQINAYRPISLLSAVGKIYERIVVNRIQKHFSRRTNLRKTP